MMTTSASADIIVSSGRCAGQLIMCGIVCGIMKYSNYDNWCHWVCLCATSTPSIISY